MLFAASGGSMRAWSIMMVLCACTRSAGGDDPLPDIALDCAPGTAVAPTGILGLSDPNTIEPVFIDLVDETGVKWVRAELHWSIIHSDPDGFAAYDAMIDA